MTFYVFLLVCLGYECENLIQGMKNIDNSTVIMLYRWSQDIVCTCISCADLREQADVAPYNNNQEQPLLSWHGTHLFFIIFKYFTLTIENVKNCN